VQTVNNSLISRIIFQIISRYFLNSTLHFFIAQNIQIMQLPFKLLLLLFFLLFIFILTPRSILYANHRSTDLFSSQLGNIIWCLFRLDTFICADFEQITAGVHSNYASAASCKLVVFKWLRSSKLTLIFLIFLEGINWLSQPSPLGLY